MGRSAWKQKKPGGLKGRIFAGVLTGILALTLGACGTKQEQARDVDLTAFQAPADYTWEGSYIDKREGLAVLTIEKEEGGRYFASLGVPSEDMSYIRTYEFTLTPSEDGVGLAYQNGRQVTYYLPGDDDPEASVTTTEDYTDGTGSVYYLEGNLYWIDDKNNAGEYFAFAKSEGTEETSASEETEN